MSARRFFALQLAVGAFAGLIMLVTNIMQLVGFITPNAGLTFVTFTAWACYFFSGCTPKDAFLSWTSFAVGAVCAIIIFVSNTFLAGFGINVVYVALPLAVMIGVIFMDYGEKLPFGNRVSAIYLGAATYFGMMGIPAVAEQGYVMVGVAEMVYAGLGFLAGYIDIAIINKFSEKSKNVKSDMETV